MGSGLYFELLHCNWLGVLHLLCVLNGLLGALFFIPFYGWFDGAQQKSGQIGTMTLTNLLHIMCGYQCDKAITKNDTREVI